MAAKDLLRRGAMRRRSFGPLLRSYEFWPYGSSTFTNSGAASTLNGSGGSVPADFVGVTIASRILARTRPFGAAEAPVINTRAVAGSSEVDVRNKVLAEAGLRANKIVSIQMGGNPVTAAWSVADANLHQAAVDSINSVMADGPKAVVSCPAFTTSSNFMDGVELMPLHEVRQGKLVREANRPNFGMIALNDVLKRWNDPIYKVAGDATAQKRFRRPPTLTEVKADGSLGVHENGHGYAFLGDEQVKVLEALSGGPVFVPDGHYYGTATTPGQKITNLPYYGVLAGCSFVSPDPLITFTVNPNGVNGPELEARLAGPPPKRANFDVVLIVRRTGYPDRTCVFRMSVISRTGTASASTRFSGRADLCSPAPLFAGSSRKLTGFIVFAREQDDGSNPWIPSNTGSDTRMHHLFASPSLSIYLNSGVIVMQANDTTGGTNKAFSVSNFSSWTIARGKRCLSFSFDGDATDGAPLKMRASAAIGSAATTAHNGTTPGNGAIDLARAGPTHIGALQTFSTNGPGDANYFNGLLDLLWLSDGGALDVRDPAIEALVFDAASRTCVDLGASGQIAGLTPNLLLRHSAAEYMAGSLTASGSARGWANAKNDGTGGDLFCRAQGYLETV